MPTPSTFTGSSQWPEAIPSESLVSLIQGHTFGPLAVESVAWIEDLPANQGNGRHFLRYDSNSTPSGTKTEGSGVFDEVALTLAENSIDVAYVGGDYPVSRELARDAAYQVREEIVTEATRALLTRIQHDTFDNVSSLSSTAGSATDQATVANWQAAMAVFKALNPPAGQMFCVMHRNAADELLRDVASTSAPFTAASAMGINPAQAGGFIGNLMGCNLYEVAAADMPVSGGGTYNCFGMEGRGMSPLALVFAERPNLEVQPEATAKCDHHVVSARFGSGLSGRPGTAWLTRTSA